MPEPGAVIHPRHHWYGSRDWLEREIYKTRVRLADLEARLLERP